MLLVRFHREFRYWSAGDSECEDRPDSLVW